MVNHFDFLPSFQPIDLSPTSENTKTIFYSYLKYKKFKEKKTLK